MGVVVGPRASERYGEDIILTQVGNGTSDRPASSLVAFVDYAGGMQRLVFGTSR